MASLAPTLTYAHPHHHHRPHPNHLHFSPSSLSLSPHFIFIISCSSSINRHRSFPVHLHRSFSGSFSNPNGSIRRCRAGISGPPPEQPDPPPDNQPVRFTGITATLSRLRDIVQIFLAVFFWMSLFFWASAWDGKNTGRGSKGDRFRR